jgi:hypothetical protein
VSNDPGSYALDDSVRYETVVLDRLKVAVNLALSQVALPVGTARVDQIVDTMRNELVFCLRYTIAGQTHSHTTSYPSDWWEALKLRFAPLWFVQRYPVRLNHVVVDAWRYWQNGPVMDKSWGREMRFVQMRDIRYAKRK